MTVNVKSGSNVPVQSPLIPDPFVPYQCRDNRTVTAFARVEEDIIQKYLEPTPFEYVDNIIAITISDFGNCDKGSFLDCAIVVPARYKDVVGGHYLFEYENEDFAIAAGRELWGYPKKYAELFLEEREDKVIAKAIKKGKEILTLEFDRKSEEIELPGVEFTPHLNLQTVPHPEGKGVIYQNVIARDTSPDFKTKFEQSGAIKVELGGDPTTPLEDFSAIEVIGGTYIKGDYYATEENGWGRIIDRLK
ncbi:acetoacetate decarboxylase family protein [Bacillus sp. es.036]|uniref:acetoacetate decarboxylase family protein n=1 Tax=Bacillus sp. es.036 TaxID=1761764 RepID=UPI000BF2788F|nr:acetoacetate decarboxylase family protein [Bacillus sp. es.036]PFG12298.1 acetoacetate decarboxylase [Bacillus sp. es.036]